MTGKDSVMNKKEELVSKLNEKIALVKRINDARSKEKDNKDPDLETDFDLGIDDKIETKNYTFYLRLKEKKGELNAPELIKIAFDENNEMYIGRKADNMTQRDFLFDPPFRRMSRIHARVTKIGTKLYITDLGSMCGTSVNGRKITPNTLCPITDGDELIFGEPNYIYELRSCIDKKENCEMSETYEYKFAFIECYKINAAVIKQCRFINNVDLLNKLCIDINIDEAAKKGLAENGILNSKFYKCTAIYKSILDTLLYKKLDLKFYDDLYINDPLKFCCNTPENYDVYQYISNMGMEFLYIRNNLFVERLSIDQINRLVFDYDKSALTPESVQIVEQTYADIIKYYTDKPDTMNVEYGPFNPCFFAPNNSIVIGVNIDFFSDNGLHDYEWEKNFFNQMGRSNEILKKIENELGKKLSIPVTVIRYDENSTIKLENKKEIMKTYTLRYLIEHEQVKETYLPGNCRVFHDVSIKKWRMTFQLDEKRNWFLSVFFNDDGTFSSFSLDAEYASDSHYEFYKEDKIRELIYQKGDEDKYFHEILIRYVKNKSGSDLLSLIDPFITMRFHYD